MLGAFRLLSVAVRRARARKPQVLEGPGNAFRLGYLVASVGDTELSVSLENVHTDLDDTDTSVLFQLSNGNALRLYFPAAGGCMLFCEGTGRVPTTTTEFVTRYPVTIGHVPVLGPLEHKEPLLQRQRRCDQHSVRRAHHGTSGIGGITTPRGSTCSRKRSPPRGREWRSNRRRSPTQTTRSMFCREARMTREVYWAGFGFQVWCQLLTDSPALGRHSTRGRRAGDHPPPRRAAAACAPAPSSRARCTDGDALDRDSERGGAR